MAAAGASIGKSVTYFLLLVADEVET